MATIVDTYIEEYDYLAEAEAYIDFYESENLTTPNLKKQSSVVFVTLTNVINLLQDRCQEISDLLDVHEDEALIILNHYKWRSDLLESDWFENEEKRRKQMGLEPQEIAVVEDTPEILCCMCFDTKPKEEFDSLKCNHIICKDCWIEYIQYNATRPENLFFWKCPLEGCNMVIPNTFNKKYIDAEKSSQYHKKMARAYTDTSKSLRWCPAADCEYGADVSSFRARAVECKCGWIYCFKCGQEDHRPVPCDVAGEWLKNGGSEEAILYQKWIAANTKDCPKCKRTIEKNQGCNHMTCRHASCGYEFCWICMEKWDPQNDHYTCKTYAALDENGRKAFDENMAKQRADASVLCQYTKSYKNYEQALQAIDKIFKMLKTDEEYFGYFGVCKHDMDFLQSACQTFRATKRILKWSYAYSFYLKPSAEKNICQILQEKLEKHSSILQGLLTEKYQEAKFGKYYAECKERIRTSEFKCQNLIASFLGKVEEFDNIAIEENIKLIQAKRENGGDEEIPVVEDDPQNSAEEMSQFFRGFNFPHM